MALPALAAQLGRAVVTSMRASRDVSMVVRALGGARHPDRHGKGVFLALGVIGTLMVGELFLGAPVAGIVQVLDRLGVRPTINLGIAAYEASSTCAMSGGDARRGAVVLLAQAYLATGAGAPSLVRGASPFGVYRNPLVGLPGYDPMRGAERIHVDALALARGGEVAKELGLSAGLAPRDWSTLSAVDGEHGLGFLLIRPSDWLAWTQTSPSLLAHAGSDRRKLLDPYQPKDAFLVMACRLRDVERSRGWALERALRDFGESTSQLWTDIQGGLPELRDRVRQAAGGGGGPSLQVDPSAVMDAASRLEAAALAGAGMPVTQIGAWYQDQVDRFQVVRGAGIAGGGTTRWPADPPPLPLGRAGPVALPAGVWYPAVSIPGFVNPFPDPTQCTWFAYQAYAEFNGDVLLGLVGDGGDWAFEAEANPRLRARVLAPATSGFGPVEGAVISFAKTPSMPYGHVGLVRQVAKDGQGALWMLIWDANWDLRGSRYQHWERWSTWSARTAGFILPPPAPEASSADSIRGVIDQAFAPLGAPAQQWGQRIAWCESHDDPRAVNPEPVGAEHARGLFQFLPSTFAGTPPGRAGASIFDPRASAEAAAWMYAQGRQAEWQCN